MCASAFLIGLSVRLSHDTIQIIHALTLFLFKLWGHTLLWYIKKRYVEDIDNGIELQTICET